jgi:hypothetical protein
MNVTKGTIYVKTKVPFVYDKKKPFSLWKINLQTLFGLNDGFLSSQEISTIYD